MFLKTEDIAKFILCCHNDGVFEGRTVIPKWWIKEASSKQVETKGIETNPDSEAGYGCGFWRCAGMENTYRCEGVYSQYAIAFEDYDACLVCTSGCSEFQKTLDIIWKHMPAAFAEEKSDFENSINLKIESSISCEARERSSIEKEIEKNTYTVKKKAFLNAIGYPVSVMPMPAVFFAKDAGGNIDNVKFSFTESGCVFSWDEDSGFGNSIFAGMNGEYGIGEINIGELKFPTHSYAFWKNENTLHMVIYPDGVVSVRTFDFVFYGGKIKIYPDMIPDLNEKSKTIGLKLKGILKGRYFHWWIDVLVPRVQRILQPVHKGKVKKQKGV